MWQEVGDNRVAANAGKQQDLEMTVFVTCHWSGALDQL